MAARTGRARNGRTVTADHSDVDRITADVARSVFAVARSELLAMDDPLDAELWASQLLSMWEDLPTAGADPVQFGASLVRHARRGARPEHAACLAALGAVAPGRLARKARTAASDLKRRGITVPAWLASLGRPVRLVSAWAASDLFGDQDAVLLEFQRGDDPPHVVHVLIDHNLGGMLKDCFVPPADLGELLDRWRDLEGIMVGELSAHQTSAMVRWGLDIYEHTLDPPTTDTLDRTLPLLRARLAAMPRTVRIVDPPDIGAREVLVREFGVSPEGRAVAGPVDDGTVSSLIVDYACDYRGDDPLRWSPTAVAIFLLDYLPRKATLDAATIPLVPVVLRAWVAFAGRRRGLPPHLVDQTLAAIDEGQDAYLAAMDDPASFGPAKSMFLEMLADGVDVEDHDAVRRWCDRFNSRPDHERLAILGR